MQPFNGAQDIGIHTCMQACKRVYASIDRLDSACAKVNNVQAACVITIQASVSISCLVAQWVSAWIMPPKVQGSIPGREGVVIMHTAKRQSHNQ